MSSHTSANEMVQDLLRVRQDLGRFPSRDEYHGIPGRAAYGKHSITNVNNTFGNWTAFMQAAGGSAHAKGKRDKQELKKLDFEARQKERASRFLVTPPPISSSVLCIGDAHFPYHHPDTVDFLIALNAKYKFDTVVCVGDEIDFHALSFHDHDADLLSPGHELEAAIKALEPLYKEFPKMLLAESNHGSLVYRKGKHHGLPRHVLKSYREVLCAPIGWEWQFEIKLQFPNGKTAFVHHAYGSNVLRCSQERGASLVQGHVHTKFGIEYWSNYDEIFFAAQTGCLIDDKSLALAYNKNQTKRPLLGSLAIINGTPKLLSLQVDRRGRWTGWVP